MGSIPKGADSLPIPLMVLFLYGRTARRTRIHVGGHVNYHRYTAIKVFGEEAEIEMYKAAEFTASPTEIM